MIPNLEENHWKILFLDRHAALANIDFGQARLKNSILNSDKHNCTLRLVQNCAYSKKSFSTSKYSSAPYPFWVKTLKNSA